MILCNYKERKNIQVVGVTVSSLSLIIVGCVMTFWSTNIWTSCASIIGNSKWWKKYNIEWAIKQQLVVNAKPEYWPL